MHGIIIESIQITHTQMLIQQYIRFEKFEEKKISLTHHLLFSNYDAKKTDKKIASIIRIRIKKKQHQICTEN